MAGKGTKRTITDERFMANMEVWVKTLAPTSNIPRLFSLAQDGLKWRQMEAIGTKRTRRTKDRVQRLSGLLKQE